MISTYWPCKPSTIGTQTVYEQYARVLPLDQKLRFQILQDLRVCIENIQFKGDLILIGMDMNDLIERYDFQVYFAEPNIHEAILATHRRTSKLVIHIFTLENYSIDG